MSDDPDDDEAYTSDDIQKVCDELRSIHAKLDMLTDDLGNYRLRPTDHTTRSDTPKQPDVSQSDTPDTPRYVPNDVGVSKKKGSRHFVENDGAPTDPDE